MANQTIRNHGTIEAVQVERALNHRVCLSMRDRHQSSFTGHHRREYGGLTGITQSSTIRVEEYRGCTLVCDELNRRTR
jgi:hypothetical protein